MAKSVEKLKATPWNLCCDSPHEHEQEIRIAELESELAHLRLSTRTLDVNDDAMVLFLEAAKAKGFVIQLIPPQSVI